MQPKSHPVTRPRYLAILPLGLLALFAFPAPAHALGDWIGVEAAPWAIGVNGEAAIDDGTTAGTRFDFKDTLGVDDSDTAPMGRLWFGWGRSHLVFDYADMSQSGDMTLAQDFTFNGTTYPASETVDSEIGLKLLQARYHFSFVNLKVVQVGFNLGLNLAQVDMGLRSVATGSTTFNEDIPYPTIGATCTVKPFPSFHIRAEVDGLSVNVSGNKVDVFDARLQIEYYFLHSFGVFGGYRSFSFNAESDDFGFVDASYDGPYVGLGLKF